MLLEFTCSNHRSIRDRVLFSTLAGKDGTFEDKVYKTCGMRVLKAAVIYGANGSGKSNLIDAIAFVKRLVMGSVSHQPGQGIHQVPHKLDGFGSESSYRVQFVSNGVRYVFGFTLKDMLVTEEYLYHFPNNRQAKIFERDGDSFSPGSKFRGRFSACRDILRPNRLMLSCAANFSSVKEVADAYLFFCNDLVIYGPGIQDDWMKYSLYQMNKDPAAKRAALRFLTDLGTGIKDIRVTIDQKKILSDELPPFLSDEFKALLLQGVFDAITAKVVYQHFETDLFREESTGVRKLFSMLCPIIDIMANGKVLICDELDSSLHESLVYGLVKLFVQADPNSYAQMVFTTHETGLLDLGLFRRDQIWFTELREDGRSTDLYSLAEIKNVRKDECFGKGYVAGKYGAIPMLNLDLARILSEM